MGIINAECGKTSVIAYQGENNRQQVRFDLSDIMGEFPGGTAMLAIRRCGDDDIVPALSTEMDGTSLLWTVTSWECANDGFLYAQVTYSVGSVVAKTKKYRFDVKDSLVVTSAEPSTWQDLVGQLVTAAEGVNSAIEAAEADLAAKVTAAEAAQGAAEVAQGKAEDAQRAAETAQGKAEDAQGAAETAQGAAEIAQGKAEDAQEAAETAQGKAEDAQSAAETAITHSPRITNGKWEVWDATEGAYVNTGVSATGEDGHGVPVGGTTGQVLKKRSGTDYDTEWSDEEGGDPTEIIDDTAGAGDTDKVWSANKSSELLTAINAKQDAPETAGTAGQVLGLATENNELVPKWIDQSGGGGQTDIGLSIVNGELCVTYEEASA